MPRIDALVVISRNWLWCRRRDACRVRRAPTRAGARRLPVVARLVFIPLFVLSFKPHLIQVWRRGAASPRLAGWLRR